MKFTNLWVTKLRLLLGLTLLVIFSTNSAIAVDLGDGSSVDILVTTETGDYSEVVEVIESAGGSVGSQFRHINGLSASVPAEALLSISSVSGVSNVSLDQLLYPGSGDAQSAQSLGGVDINSPGDLDASTNAGKAFVLGAEREVLNLSGGELDTYYSYFPDSQNTGSVFATGNSGQDSLVVIIDTGTYADHFMLAGKVIGGVDLSTDVGTPFEGATVVTNHYHGTHVGGIVAGAGAILLPPGDILGDSVEYNAGITLPDIGGGTRLLPLLGTAPAAELYAVKVFPHTGAGAPTSTIIAGIEHAIDLKLSGVDVDVINMSLGGGNGFEGRDLESQVVDAATAAGITVVVSAGNDGPASQTVGTPSGANTAITVGAIAHPVNTRVFWDLNFGFIGAGDLLYVDNNPQMIYFSSRGGTSDGREKPTASAVGTFVLSAFTGSPGALGFSSGTSMSSPALAGIVALLNSEAEANGLGASPYDYKEAVIAGSNPLPGFSDFEQGAGFIDAEQAIAALLADTEFGSGHPPLSNGYSSKSKKPEGTSIQGANGKKGATFTISDLPPGHVEHFYLNLHPNAERITLNVSNVDLGVDPILFNSFEVHVMSGMRTTDSGYYFATTNVWGDAEFVIESLNSQVSGAVFGVNSANLPLMPGYVRISIENDWTSFDDLSGTFTVNVEHGDNSDKPDESYSGTLSNYDSEGFFPIGFGPNGVDLELDWKNNWTAYPASDMDLIVAWFDSGANLHFDFSGATLNSPELVELNAAGILGVFVLIDAFETYGQNEQWTLEVRHK